MRPIGLSRFRHILILALNIPCLMDGLHNQLGLTYIQAPSEDMPPREGIGSMQEFIA